MLLLFLFTNVLAIEKFLVHGPAERLIRKLLVTNKYDNNVRPIQDAKYG